MHCHCFGTTGGHRGRGLTLRPLRSGILPTPLAAWSFPGLAHRSRLAARHRSLTHPGPDPNPGGLLPGTAAAEGLVLGAQLDHAMPLAEMSLQLRLRCACPAGVKHGPSMSTGAARRLDHWPTLPRALPRALPTARVDTSLLPAHHSGVVCTQRWLRSRVCGGAGASPVVPCRSTEIYAPFRVFLRVQPRHGELSDPSISFLHVF